LSASLPPSQTRVSPRGLDIIKRHEGLRLNAYLCPAGVWTIGYGHTSAAGAPTVKPGMRITEAEALAILARDLGRFEARVNRLVKVPLTQHQFDALVSFDFNTGAIHSSTLLRKLNAGRHQDVPAELMRWTRAGGKELPGLVRRRREEAGLWRSLDEHATGGTADAGAGQVTAAPVNGKSLAKSRTMAGGGIAATGGIVVAVQEARNALTEAKPNVTEGSMIGLVLGVVILIGAGIAIYARWDDAGRPLPWRS
jgi:lysozyme